MLISAEPTRTRCTPSPTTASVICCPSMNVPMCESASRSTRSSPRSEIEQWRSDSSASDISTWHPLRPIQSGCSPMVKIVLTESFAPRAMTRMERGLPPGAGSAAGAAAADAASSSTRYGPRSTSLISLGLSSRASSAALLPDSHSPHFTHVAIEFGSRTATTPGTSYA